MPADGYPVLWYSAADEPPPLEVRVWLKWGARPPFEAALVANPQAKRRGEPPRKWLISDSGRPVLLPSFAPPEDPREPWVGWHTLSGWPDWWRPLRPELWRLALPAPGWIETGPPAPGRMWSATQRFGAVDAAEAADLAREMEADRETARAQHGTGAGGRLAAGEQPAPTQYWRDPFAVTYSAPGSISRREAEGRLMRAFAAEHWVRVDRPADATFAGILARLARTVAPTAAELAAEDPRPLRPEPSPQDWDDMLTALGWLKGLGLGGLRGRGGSERRGGVTIVYERRRTTVDEDLLRLRERDPPLSWRRIGKALGLSHEAARTGYERALDAITATANGEATAGATHIAARLDAVRDANTRARRG